MLTYSSVGAVCILNQGWFTASAAEILSFGLFYNNFLQMSIASGLSLFHKADGQEILQALFLLNISEYSLALKTNLEVNKMYMITPTLKTSALHPYP